MLRAIIIDDEVAGVDSLRLLAGRMDKLIRVLGSSTKAEEGIELIEAYQPDLVLLDIQMPGMNGFEMLEKLHFRDFALVFTTAHQQYAIDAIKKRAFDYLLKPVTETDFRNCLEALQAGEKKNSTPQAEHDPLLELQVRDGIVYIRQHEVLRLEAARSYTEIFLDNGVKHIASRNLKDFESRLDPRFFFRCHKSHIVNLRKVKKLVIHQGFYAQMQDGSMPEISRHLKDVFLERIRIS